VVHDFRWFETAANATCGDRVVITDKDGNDESKIRAKGMTITHLN
jgi:hypothetical protein